MPGAETNTAHKDRDDPVKHHAMGRRLGKAIVAKRPRARRLSQKRDAAGIAGEAVDEGRGAPARRAEPRRTRDQRAAENALVGIEELQGVLHSVPLRPR